MEEKGSKIKIYLRNGVIFEILENFVLTKKELKEPEFDWYEYSDISGENWFVRVSDIMAIVETKQLKDQPRKHFLVINSKKILDIMIDLEKKFGKHIPLGDILKKSTEKEIEILSVVIKKMKEEGMIFESREGVYQRV